MTTMDGRKFKEWVGKSPLHIKVLTQHDGLVTHALKEAFSAGIKVGKEAAKPRRDVMVRTSQMILVEEAG